jgi:hypothetical protein
MIRYDSLCNLFILYDTRNLADRYPSPKYDRLMLSGSLVIKATFHLSSRSKDQAFDEIARVSATSWRQAHDLSSRKPGRSRDRSITTCRDRSMSMDFRQDRQAKCSSDQTYELFGFYFDIFLTSLTIYSIFWRHLRYLSMPLAGLGNTRHKLSTCLRPAHAHHASLWPGFQPGFRPAFDLLD